MSYDPIFQQALRLHEEGHLLEAERIYRQILAMTPKNADVLNLLGLVAQSKGINNEAVDLFYQAIQEASNHAPFHFNLAMSLEMLGKTNEAIKYYTKALEIDPNIKEAYNNLGLLTQSRDYFLYAIDIDQDYVEAKANLALTYDENEAVLRLKMLIEQYPDQAIGFYLLSKLTNDLSYAQKALDLAPNSFEVQNQLGIIYSLQKNLSEAQKCFERSIALEPNNTVALINLANITDNEDLYKKALDIAPNDLDAHINYANLLYKQKRTSEALEEYRKAVIINPDIAEVSNNLAVILKDLGEYEEALGLFFNAFLKKPEMEEFSLNIVETLVLLHQKEPKKALDIAKNWQKNAKENLFAEHIVAALKGEKAANDKIYNKKLFDHFADNYELVLERIDYCLPRSVRDIVADVKGSVLDLGCGSGLVAEAFAKNSEVEWTGVDISEKMLDLAQAKGLYKNLILSDVVEFLQNNKKHYDYIIAADVLCYFNELSEIVKFCKGSTFCFSIEKFDGDEDYKLMPSGRYQHNPRYIETLLQKSGFKNIKQYPLILRKEADKNVEGIIFYAKE